MRVIDADALIKRIDTLKHRIAGPAAGYVAEDSYECGALDGLTDAQNYAKEAETVEAIPVVRCRDCRYWETPFDKNDTGFMVAHCKHFDESHAFNEQFYCANGERRDEDALSGR